MDCKDCELLARAQRLIEQQQTFLDLQAEHLKLASAPPILTASACERCGQPITDPVDCCIPHANLCHACWDKGLKRR